MKLSSGIVWLLKGKRQGHRIGAGDCQETRGRACGHYRGGEPRDRRRADPNKTAGYPKKTAIGFAVSTDGLIWQKNPENPVLRPAPKRPWESNYTTSQSVLRLSDGTLRIWYASRKKPPFVNKYFAINTAKWFGIEAK